jgi:putative endonuclease
MAKHLEKGKQGEDIACNYLLKEGYQILFRNWKLEKAEIDIIALEGQELVFVEVRLRTHAEDIPELSISARKTELLCEAASYFADTHTKINYVTTRFDVIGIQLRGNKPQLNHYKDVFR